MWAIHEVFNARSSLEAITSSGRPVLWLKDKNAVTISQLSLVDLAGSERTDRTGSTGYRLREAGTTVGRSLGRPVCFNTLTFADPATWQLFCNGRDDEAKCEFIQSSLLSFRSRKHQQLANGPAHVYRDPEGESDHWLKQGTVSLLPSYFAIFTKKFVFFFLGTVLTVCPLPLMALDGAIQRHQVDSPLQELLRWRRESADDCLRQSSPRRLRRDICESFVGFKWLGRG